MNKKVIRIFIAVCLMLAMTSSTAFAETRTVTKIRNCYLYLNTSDDHAYLSTHYKDGRNPQVISIKVVYTYVSGDKLDTIGIISSDATIFGDNAKRYYCEIKQRNSKNVDFKLYDEKKRVRIGYIHAYLTSGHFKYQCHNERGPH